MTLDNAQAWAVLIAAIAAALSSIIAAIKGSRERQEIKAGVCEVSQQVADHEAKAQERHERRN